MTQVGRKSAWFVSSRGRSCSSSPMRVHDPEGDAKLQGEEKGCVGWLRVSLGKRESVWDGST